MTPDLLSAISIAIKSLRRLEISPSSDRERQVALSGRKTIDYQNSTGKTLTIRHASAHDKIAGKQVMNELEAAWKTWQTLLGQRVNTLHPSYSRPAVRAFFDIIDDLCVLGDVVISFGDVQLGWRRHPAAISGSRLPSQRTKACGEVIDTVLGTLAPLPKATAIYGFGQLTTPKGYTKQSMFETFSGASPAHAALAMAYVRNPTRHLAQAKDSARDLLTQDLIEIVSSKSALKTLATLEI